MELKDKKITVTGGTGFLGSYIIQKLKERGVPEENILIPTSNEFDLRKMENCHKVVAGRDIVIHLAATVGGIGFNREHPGSLYYDNLMMGAQLMEAARLAKVGKFVALGTICAYPKFTPTPFKETDIWNGYPEETNAPYGLAKKMMLVQAQAYRQEYGFNSIFLLPVNLYGPRDNFNPNSSHVIPALIKKIHEAKETNQPFVEVWGTGMATREFLFAEDAAEGIILAAENYDGAEPINLGSAMEISIKELVQKICQLMDYRGDVRWDSTKPDGQPRRMLDVSQAQNHFNFRARTDFDTGLKLTIDWYRAQQAKSTPKKKALITGITGQDGSYLAELLLEKGYEVHGIIRRSSSFNTGRINHIYNDIHEAGKKLILHYGDLSDSSNLSRLLTSIQPEEIYNLGAQSHVRVSFDTPEYTADVTGLGTLRILDAIRESGIKTKFYQASSSEMFGQVQEVPQSETTPFYPRSPYGCAKVFGYWITKNYRESYDLFACNGILFNHESERRGETFVTRKITRGLAKIKLGRQEKLYLGNLDAKRDWGYAKDYVEAMWLMLQQDQPDDYVVATGETHTVREFIEECAKHLGINLIWQGSGLDEKGIDASTGKTIIEIDPAYFRPTEVELLIGDSSKAKQQIGWEPKTKFKELVKIMVDFDLEKENKLSN